MWPNVWAVIRREYLQRIRSRSFLIGTLAAPLLMIVLIVIPAVITGRGNDTERTVTVVDRTGVLGDAVEADLERMGWTVEVEPWTPDVEERLRQRAEAGDLNGFVVLDDSTLTDGVSRLETTRAPSPLGSFTLQTAVAQAALRRRLEESGGDGLASGGDLRIHVLSDAPGVEPDEQGPQFAVAFFGAMMLYMIILIYSVAVMRATLEEKTSRIAEVIISSMEPWHLLLGKIIGVGGVSLTQLGIWMGTVSLGAVVGLPTLVSARPDLTGLVDLRAALPGLGMLVLFVGFFLGGFFMFSSIYAAVGAMVSSDEEANQVQFPVVLLLVGPVMMITPALRDPTAPWAVATSLFPLFSPILMWARVVAGGAPPWQVALSFVLMALAILGIAWVAGRIYRVGILMTGKRPTLPELWRWVRAA